MGTLVRQVAIWSIDPGPGLQVRARSEPDSEVGWSPALDPALGSQLGPGQSWSENMNRDPLRLC